MGAVSFSGAQPYPGGAPAARLAGRVAEGFDARIALEQGAHGLALHPDPFAVNDAQGAKALLPGRVEVVAHDVGHLRRLEAVEVEHVGDGKLDGLEALEVLAVPAVAV